MFSYIIYFKHFFSSIFFIYVTKFIFMFTVIELYLSIGWRYEKLFNIKKIQDFISYVKKFKKKAADNSGYINIRVIIVINVFNNSNGLKYVFTMNRINYVKIVRKTTNWNETRVLCNCITSCVRLVVMEKSTGKCKCEKVLLKQSAVPEHGVSIFSKFIQPAPESPKNVIRIEEKW